MALRTQLHSLLESALGSSRVYYQAPDTRSMSYPCIVYEWASDDVKFANGKKYVTMHCYTVTVIDANPDSLIPGKLLELPYSEFRREFKADNLNHFVINIYF